MRIVYMGSPGFAVPPLAMLAEAGYELKAVITQPDRPRNRGRLSPTPVKERAFALGIPVYTPEKIKSAEAISLLKGLNADLFAVVAYGQLISAEALALPPLGTVNIHASLLPAYRGAAPIQHALINGEDISGVTTMYLDQGMDTGNTILSRAVPLDANETAGELHDRLSVLGGELLLETLSLIKRGAAPSIPQRHEEATYAPPLKPADERIDWRQSANQAHNRIRGLNPHPGAFTIFRGKRLKLWRSLLPEALPVNAADSTPGEIIGCGNDGLFVRCGEGALILTQVQPEGKARMAAQDFARGYRIEKGELLGGGDDSQCRV